MQTVVTAASLLSSDGLLPDPILVFEDGRIQSIATRESAALTPAAQHHDYPGLVLAPAYLDVHTHGCRNRDVMEATPEALDTIGGFLAQHGVGAYLPTTITATKDKTLRSLSGLATLLAAPPSPGCAQPLGIHIEGPFLSHAKRGTHPPQHLLEPSISFFDQMWEAAEGRIALMTIAPELPGAIELIAHAAGLGVRISIGHSDATSAQAEAAIAAGAVSATHTFNAMRKLDQRHPGILGAVLSTDTLFAELICDGLHVDPMLVKLFARAKGPARAILVTDAMSATGMPDGTYKLGELDVRVQGGRATTGEDTLAGSTLSLNVAVENYLRFAQASLADGLYAASRNPAAMILHDGSFGTLAPGRAASFNVLTSTGALQAAYLRGQRLSA